MEGSNANKILDAQTDADPSAGPISLEVASLIEPRTLALPLGDLSRLECNN